ncbi:hypothetical protein BDY21DRAFT_331970 [Lineolata rhizophorae]|uniref:Uncharacterized protein n=1 Tax=Lineolata rhizophorae TaxID=578093 RepID=A0A6A6PBW6_9PEZI|nr:hypothetical protein BDY21DRAFT_331970 [Lineolata rhizophorae]
MFGGKGEGPCTSAVLCASRTPWRVCCVAMGTPDAVVFGAWSWLGRSRTCLWHTARSLPAEPFLSVLILLRFLWFRSCLKPPIRFDLE